MKMKKRNERKRYGRFFYRFPNGESGADLYDRITIFQDHLIRDINAGRFSNDTTLVSCSRMRLETGLRIPPCPWAAMCCQ